MWYLIQNQTVVHKRDKKLRAYVGDYVESEEDWPLGSSYIVDPETGEGVFGEPVKTYMQEREELSADYQSQLKANAESFAMIQYMDGENEEANKAASRVELAALKAQHQADMAALFTKHFGG